MEDKQGARFLVQGRVQGVFFRASTKREALTLGLTGWVRNTNDGHVEVLAFGSTKQLSELETWLHQGPKTARVDLVTQTPALWESHQSFKINYF
jgi:acylphosphatase